MNKLRSIFLLRDHHAKEKERRSSGVKIIEDRYFADNKLNGGDTYDNIG